MKKLLTLLTVLFITAPAYAQEKVEITVKKERSLAEIIQAGQANAAAARTAQAAAAAAMSDSSSEIKVPLTVDLNNYTDIALVGVVYAGGSTGKRYYKDFKKTLSFSPLNTINPADYDKKKFKKNNAYLRSIKNPNWLYVTYRRSTSGVDEIRILIIRDSNNKVLYSASHINVPSSEVVSILTDF